MVQKVLTEVKKKHDTVQKYIICVDNFLCVNEISVWTIVAFKGWLFLRKSYCLVSHDNNDNDWGRFVLLSTVSKHFPDFTRRLYERHVTLVYN